MNWVIFVLGTNSPLDDLDEAVRREGRFDFVEEISFPVLSAQLTYVKKKYLGEPSFSLVKETLEKYDKYKSLGKDIPGLTFSLIDELMKEIRRRVEDGRKIDEDLVDSLLRYRLAHPGPRNLVDR